MFVLVAGHYEPFRRSAVGDSIDFTFDELVGMGVELTESRFDWAHIVSTRDGAIRWMGEKV